jgi:hypothetical protein
MHVLTLKGIINPPAVNYIQRGINQAEEAGAAAIILQLPIASPALVSHQTNQHRWQTDEETCCPCCLDVCTEGEEESRDE